MKTSFPILCMGLLALPALAEPVVEKYDDGKPKLKYAVDAEGRKDGPYTAYSPEGKITLKAVYKAGKLHGKLTQYAHGRTVLTQTFANGKLVHPKTLEDMRKTLRTILASGEKPTGKAALERQAALRRLKAYRYLVDVPYENLELDDEMNDAAEAASKICAKLGRLDHAPKNPGWPEDEYKLAYKGASHSNLAAGTNFTLVSAVTEWMTDSDEANIDRLGHRRWCINPAMKKLGFGRAGMFMAMWAFDKSQPKVPDYSFVAYPPRGLMPLEYFRPVSAWSVSLNPRKYRKPDKSAEPKIYRFDPLLQKVGEPLKLNYVNLNTMGFGIPYCIIFRPDKDAVQAGKRYLVEIDDLKTSDGKPTMLRYVVEFTRLKGAAR